MKKEHQAAGIENIVVNAADVPATHKVKKQQNLKVSFTVFLFV